MGLGKLESFLENHIEGFFNKRLASELEPAELVRALQREVAQQAKTNAEHVVPNKFWLQLSTEDYNRLCANRIQIGLYTCIEKAVIKSDACMDGELELHMQPDASQLLGNFKLQTGEPEQVETEAKAEPDTIVLERSTLNGLRPLNLPPDYKLAALKVLDGPDQDAYLEFGERKIYLGRRDKNEFILTDHNASRLHAWIAYERHRHVLYDANSTNGTFVGEEQIERCVLQDGDQITIGSTIIKYEVI